MPQIAPGTTQSSDPTACPGGIEYWAMNLQDGDTLTINGTPMPSSGGKSYMDLDIYGPNIQTIGGQPLCSSDFNGSPFTESCPRSRCCKAVRQHWNSAAARVTGSHSGDRIMPRG